MGGGGSGERRISFGVAYDALDTTRDVAGQLDAMLRAAELVESLGFDSIWFGETHRRKAGHGHFPTPLLLAAAVAARTGRLQIGTAVLLLPAYSPLQAAEQAAVVDQLSAGRLLLGVAPGLEVYRDFGFANLGVRAEGLTERTVEGLGVVRRLWSEPTVTHKGRFYEYEEAACVPGPHRPGGPPIYMGGITPRAIAQAAAVDGWIGGTPYPLGLLEKVRQRLDEARAAQPDDDRAAGSTFCLIRPVVVDRSGEEARELSQRHLAPLIRYYLDRGAYIDESFQAVRRPPPSLLHEAMAQIGVVGNPGECRAALRRYAELAGVDHFILRVRFPGSDEKTTEGALRLLAEEVLPAFRQGEVAAGT